MEEDARARVLVVEDDASLNEIVCTCLAQEGYACTPVFSGSEARLVLEQAGRCERAAAAPASGATVPQIGTAGAMGAEPPRAGTSTSPSMPPAAPAGPATTAPFDLIITDLMLPGMPGEELVPLARRVLGATPIIVTSAKGAVQDRVALLRTGADDYLVKPFDLDELAARVAALLRRAGGSAGGAASGHGAPSPAADASDEPVLAFGAWRLSPSRRAFTVAEAPVKLTRTEFDLVATLMAHPDRVFSKRELYTLCCADDPALPPTVSDEKTVVTHMGNLRAKLKPTGTDGYLETVWGIGFKLRADGATSG